MLKSLGLLKDDAYDYSVYAGSVIAVLLSMFSLWLMLRLLMKDVFTDPRRMSVILLVLLIAVILSAVGVAIWIIARSGKK